MTAVNGDYLRAGLARLKAGTTWSAPSTAKCPGFATNNSGESSRIDAYVDALALGGTPVPPTMLTDTGNGIVMMLGAMIMGATTGPILFEDTFAGAAGSPPDPAKWWSVNSTGETWDNWCRCPASNAYLSGDGNLVLRAKRDTAGPNGMPYSGAWIATFNYGWGWPASTVKAAWAPPFRYETRWKMPNVKAAHDSAGWLQTTDVTTAQKGYEIDCGEARSTFPLEAGFHQHTWQNGVDIAPVSFGTAVTDWRSNWHTVACEVRTDRVDHFLDGVKVKTHYGVAGRLGAILHNPISREAWQSGGAYPPVATDLGPWDMLVDYVRVTGL